MLSIEAGGALNKSEVKLGLSVRPLFPIFADHVDPALSYLDTAASSQKPQRVIDRLSSYLSHEHANIHRGAYALSASATDSYDEARARVAGFLGADPANLVFTRGTTESINLVARAWGERLKAGDVVLLTLLEHHSNIVPWQLLAERRGVKVAFVDITDCGELDLADLQRKLKDLKPKLLSVTQMANSLGTIVPIEEAIEMAHAVGARVLVDAAQSVAHLPIDVGALAADFLAFSAHKLYGPTGVGALYVREECYGEMEPFQGGGDMIRTVTTEGSTWAEPPQMFEAGTPAIAEAIAFGEAIEFVRAIGVERIARHEDRVFEFAHERLSSEPGVTVYGPATRGGRQGSIISFNLDKVHPHDLSTVADNFNVQIRAGHHCAMPTLRRLGIPASARMSLGMYSDVQDIERLLTAIREAKRIFW